MKNALLVDQRPVQPSKRIGKGGEGEVYALGDDPSHAIKLYTITNPGRLEPKIRAMIQAGLAEQAAQVAFPVAIVTTEHGQFAGFVMRLVREHKPLHELYSPGSRKNHFPRADYRFLVRTALNIAKAIASVHRLGCVIGDINHSSVLVSLTAMVALIDADSFQITAGHERFLCRVGVPEYTPPELQGMPLGSVVRTPNHDAFGLAVVIFQLLFMGRHPFMGTVRKGESPTLPQAIKDVRFVYTENRDVGMDQPPGTPTLSDFPRTVADLFETAFLTNPTQVRPTAAQWVSALEELEKSLIQCADEKLHRYPKDASECPWCAMERELGVTLFIPYIPPTSIHAAAFDPGANGFDLGSVWRRIVSVGYLDRAQVAPQLTSQAISPSDSVRKTVLKRRLFIGGRLLLGGAAIAVAWFAPLAWILWLPVALYAAFGGRVKGSMAADNLLRQFGEVERKWRGALENWYKRIGVDTASDLYQSLNQAKLAYEALGKEETTLRRAYMDQRRARQLHAYLDNFEIRHSRIKGIGPAKEAALTSYGIETAADVVLSKVLTVPGFGPTNSQALMQWRAKLEGRFAYSGNENDIDRQELAKIAANIQAKAAQLRRTLLAGPANLQTLLARAKGLAAVKDPELARIQVARLQILADLEYLGIPKSVIDQRARAQSSTQPAQAAPPTARPQPVPPSQSRVSCPRCGSPMVRRTARRGRNAGNQFWGCSRYPQCKGTRN